MKLGYDLTIEQTQKLAMTPELIQAIQILQFNTQELDNFVQEQMLVNPVLELSGSSSANSEGGTAKTGQDSESLSHEAREKKEEDSNRAKEEEFVKDWKEQIRDTGKYDDISYRQGSYQSNDKDYSFEQFVTFDVTLPEHLLFQLQFVKDKKQCKDVCRYIIESLDENGYMTLSVEEIEKNTGASFYLVKKAIAIVQEFEPSGVGAKDLRECLLIQLRNKDKLTQVIESVILNYLEELADNKLGHIAKELGILPSEVQEIGEVIRSLEPKPGRQFANQMDTKYIVPDVVVERNDEEYVVVVNERSTPCLMIGSYYKSLLEQSEHDENLSKYLSDRVNSAIWLIKSIEQRKHTIYNVVNAVVKYQKDFFQKGEKHLKTLTLKQIADEVGIHESTVSRSINGKYMQSPRGMFEIKYFFTSGVSGEEGEGISSNSIKSFIKEIIDNEDTKSPYSDQHIVEILNQKSISISRRTVAKYRDEMKIPSSSKRKRY